MKQQSQRRNYDIHAKFLEFAVGDSVFVHDIPAGEKLSSGTVFEITSPIFYHVTSLDGHAIHLHVDHVHACKSFTADLNHDGDVIGNLVTTMSPFNPF